MTVAEVPLEDSPRRSDRSRRSLLIPLLVQAGHEVAGTTRRTERAGLLRDLGAEPVIVDMLDGPAVRDAVAAQRPTP